MNLGYSPLGLITSYDDGTTQGTYGYDVLGRFETASVDYGPFTKSHSYTYDVAGRKATYTNPEGVTYAYQYNGNGDFLGMTLPGTGQITVNEYQWLSPIRITYPGGLTLEDERDGLLRMDLRTLKDQAGNPIASLDYGYNAENHITDLERDDGSSRYGYDELYRLTEFTEYGEEYTYDGVGNRLTQAGDSTTWTYNANHQLLSTGTATYTYNPNGHRATKIEGGETLAYTYDLEERLIEVSSSVSGTVATYTYDPFGRRVRKIVGTTTTYFHYDDTGLIAEYDDAGNLVSEYQYTPGSPWMTNPLFKRDGSTGTVHFFLNDHLGTPRKLFDGSAQVTWAARYEAFGQAVITTELTSNSLRFPGQYEDLETGTHYNRFRSYDPQTGRYLEEDPLGLVDGPNTYVYARNGPTRFSDPLGLRAPEVLPPNCFVFYENISVYTGEPEYVTSDRTTLFKLRVPNPADFIRGRRFRNRPRTSPPDMIAQDLVRETKTLRKTTYLDTDYFVRCTYEDDCGNSYTKDIPGGTERGEVLGSIEYSVTRTWWERVW